MFNKKNAEAVNNALNELTVPAFGYELIRETFLKDILGKDYNSILYWGGKNLARKNPLNSQEEIIQFFDYAGWGTLSVTKESKNEILFELTSEWIQNRLKREGSCSFQLEAGFLAEQVQCLVKADAEAMEQQKRKQGLILFTVQWH